MIGFLKDARQLMLIERFVTLKRIQKESVAEHSFFTALYAMLVADLEIKNGKSVNVEKVLRIALLHDLEETSVSDIPRPIKHATPEFRSEVQKVGERVVSQILSDLPEPLKLSYLELWKVEKDEALESRICRASDLLEALIWVVEEEEMGNTNVQKLGIKEELLNEIKRTGVDSALELAHKIIEASRQREAS